MEKKHINYPKLHYFRPVFQNDKAMKRTITFKSLLITASILSLFAFAFVNLRVTTGVSQPFASIQLPQNQIESEDAAQSQDMTVPNVTVLGRVWEIAQRLLDNAN